MTEVQIYIHRDGQQQGPYTLPQLQLMSLTPDTPVWYQGLADWVPASQAPVTAPLFNDTAQVPPTPGMPRPVMPATPQIDEKPSSYLGWAVAACILCCVPLGIVAIIFASQVNDKWLRGDYEGARRASSNAQLWTILSIVFGIISSIAILVLQPAILTGYMM